MIFLIQIGRTQKTCFCLSEEVLVMPKQNCTKFVLLQLKSVDSVTYGVGLPDSHFDD